MAEPFIQKVTMPGVGEITSVVLDQEDFNSFADQLVGLIEAHASSQAGEVQRSTEEQISSIKVAGILPMMGRGSKTEQFFEQWGVETDRMCVCARGLRNKVFGDE